MNYIEQLLATSAKELFNVVVQPAVTRPAEQFGDYSTNLAMQLAGQLKRSARDLAEELKDHLEQDSNKDIVKVEVAGPGFLNITLSDQALWGALGSQPGSLKGQKVLLEYSCPNAFKELHTGHLYNTILGDSLSVLLEQQGAKVYRANFGGDVGLHVGKCLWGILEALGGEEPNGLVKVPPAERANWLSQAYVAGAQAYEADQAAKQKINQLNQAVYQIHVNNDRTSSLAQIYWQCREWSYQYFKDFYGQLGAKSFDKFYPESSTTKRGLETVQQHLGKVFSKSQGAIIFPGEEHGYHTRVFVTSAGLPTYETKDLGVILTEQDDFAYDKRIVLTGNDQAEYMKVVFAALSQIDTELAAKQTNLTNGTVRFGDGKKMSSRLGNVLPANQVIETVHKAVQADSQAVHQAITLGAIRYTFLKQRIGGDIAFDVQESVSLQGNSGPYLQYAHARARSILAKAAGATQQPTNNLQLEPAERSLVRKLGEYPEVINQAVQELAPHLICTYLYELAQNFNRFYEHNRVMGDERQALRLALVKSYASALHDGLTALNIPAPEHL